MNIYTKYVGYYGKYIFKNSIKFLSVYLSLVIKEIFSIRIHCITIGMVLLITPDIVRVIPYIFCIPSWNLQSLKCCKSG